MSPSAHGTLYGVCKLAAELDRAAYVPTAPAWKSRRQSNVVFAGRGPSLNSNHEPRVRDGPHDCHAALPILAHQFYQHGETHSGER